MELDEAVELTNLEKVSELSFALQTILKETNDVSKKTDIIKKYIDTIENTCLHTVPDFEPDLEWLNTDGPLSLNDQLQGKVVALDFFTYCCINCMHILPDLEVLETSVPVEDGLVVVGVHSAKFDNEKVGANILSAVLRYNITHPVVNDSEAKLWHELQISCWPTVVFLGPKGQMLLTLAGEGYRQVMLDFARVAVDYYREKGDIRTDPIPIRLAKTLMPELPLKFPGKVAIKSDGTIAVSDTGHHRILVLDSKGIVQEVIGGSKAGFSDGHFKSATFCSPQGVAWHKEVIFVADTENHAIRQIDLKNKLVSTLAGTGTMGEDKEGGKPGEQQDISSPWDLVVGKSVGSSEDNVIYIAMAGTHQIWMYFLKDGEGWKKRKYSQGTCVRMAGSGHEENRNNSYPQNAGFAQPSGLTIGHKEPDKEHLELFVADSESSSIRSVSLENGAVKGVAGGAKDPKNLFTFGDEDGKNVFARLQHPLGVAMQNVLKGPLLVADSYNHKIKTIDLRSKECVTLLGSGKPGNATGARKSATFNEPGGIGMHPKGEILYIADTNNHKIKMYDFIQETVTELPIILPNQKVAKDEVDGPSPKKPKSLVGKTAEIIELDTLAMAPSTDLELKFNLKLQPGVHLTEEAPSAWQIGLHVPGQYVPDDQPRKGKITSMESQPTICFQIPENGPDNVLLVVECVVYYCDDHQTCRMKGIEFRQKLQIETEAKKEMKQHELSYIFKFE